MTSEWGMIIYIISNILYQIKLQLWTKNSAEGSCTHPPPTPRNNSKSKRKKSRFEKSSKMVSLSMYFPHLRWEFIKENKKVRKQENKKTRTRPRKWSRKKESFSFFSWSLSWSCSCFLFFSWSLFWSSFCFLVFFLSCFLL